MNIRVAYIYYRLNNIYLLRLIGKYYCGLLGQGADSILEKVNLGVAGSILDSILDCSNLTRVSEVMSVKSSTEFKLLLI